MPWPPWPNAVRDAGGPKHGGPGSVLVVAKLLVPSGKETWRAGSWTTKLSDFRSSKPQLSPGVFQPCLMTPEGMTYRSVLTC